MAAVVSAAEIPPGGEGKIEVKVSTKGRKGNLQKSITVYSNDPANPRYMLKMQGDVEVLAGFEPSRLDLKNVAKGSTLEKTVQIIAKEPDKLKLTDIVSSKPEEIKAEVVEDAGKPSLKVTITTPEKAGRFSGRITAKTGLESPKEIQLFVYGQITADLVVDRSYVYFAPPANAGKGSLIARSLSGLAGAIGKRSGIMKLKISSLAGKPFSLKGVEDKDKVVVGSVEKTDDAWNVYLMLLGQPTSRRGLVKILTDREDQPEVEVRYGSSMMGKPRVTPMPGSGAKRPAPVRFEPGKSPANARKLRAAPSLRKMAPQLQKKTPAFQKKDPEAPKP
jgi:hypothetical protein